MKPNMSLQLQSLISEVIRIMIKTRASVKKIYLVGEEVVNLESNCLPTKRHALSNYLYLRLKQKTFGKYCLAKVVDSCEVIFKSLNKSVGNKQNSRTLNKCKSRRTVCQLETE